MAKRKPMKKEKKNKKEIRITELQRFYAPLSWYETVVENRLQDGYVFYKDPTNGDYVLVKNQPKKPK